MANGFAYVATTRRGLDYENKYKYFSAYRKQPFENK